jgi:hypothetical protein
VWLIEAATSDRRLIHHISGFSAFNTILGSRLAGEGTGVSFID